MLNKLDIRIIIKAQNTVGLGNKSFTIDDTLLNKALY